MGNAIDAEDALSRAMLKAWEKLRNSMVEIKNFKSWVTKLTYNICVDIHRESRRGGKQVESLDATGFEYQEEIASQEENPLIAATEQELANFFSLAIDELPPKLRETFILHFKEELSYKEIAEKLNISYDNVRKRICQARKILKQRYEQDFLGVEDRHYTHLDSFKSHPSSQSSKSTKSENINQIEVCAGENVTVSEELEKVQITNQEEAKQLVTVSASVVVNVQSKMICKNSFEVYKKLCNQPQHLLSIMTFTLKFLPVQRWLKEIIITRHLIWMRYTRAGRMPTPKDFYY
jgi:RNA polymerase sigma-70 factor (ECF subfamily)